MTERRLIIKPMGQSNLFSRGFSRLVETARSKEGAIGRAGKIADKLFHPQSQGILDLQVAYDVQRLVTNLIPGSPFPKVFRNSMGNYDVTIPQVNISYDHSRLLTELTKAGYAIQ